MSTSTYAESGQLSSQEEDDLDALHTLPLCIIPLKTIGLRKAKYVKNARLENVVELFSDATAGSGQISPPDLVGFFPSDRETIEQDIKTLDRLSTLGSFDIYSLRLKLRELDIGFEDFDVLKLSDKKRAELTVYMNSFTRPLITKIYGNEAGDLQDVSDIIKLFSNPDREFALKQLKTMAEQLRIPISAIPKFLEDYGDIFLSISYFKNCLDNIMENMDPFLEWAEETTQTYQVAHDKPLQKQIFGMTEDFKGISTSIVGRFEVFDRRSKDFWNDVTAESFREVQDFVRSQHVTIGAVLCGLAVKLDLWKKRFPNQGGGPQKRIEFIRSEILPGLSHTKSIEERAGAI
ncbi:MAG: hypothetical protein NXI16_08510 [Alphaproteobacteria bacterium]|nr:hypothetical protein [Alphaproteobacteria bacterium]